MNWEPIIHALEQAAAGAVEASSVAENIPVQQVAGIAKIVNSAAQFAQDVLEHVDAAAGVLSDPNLDRVKAATATLRAANDELAAKVAAA